MDENYLEKLNEEKIPLRKNIGLVVRLCIYCLLCFFLILLNALIYATNKNKLGVHLAFVILAITLPAIGAGSILTSILMKDISKKLRDFMFDLLPFTTIIFSFFVLLGPQLFHVYKVNGDSMNPNLKNGQIVLSFKYNVKPQNGDIVICYINGNKKNTPFIKRVWAKPLDEVEFVRINETSYQMHVLRNEDGKRFTYEVNGNQDYYFSFGQIKNMFNIGGEPEIGETTNFYRMKPEMYMIIGDNFYNSQDSRKYGLVHISHIAGKVVSPHGK